MQTADAARALTRGRDLRGPTHCEPARGVFFRRESRSVICSSCRAAQVDLSTVSLCSFGRDTTTGLEKYRR